MQDLKQKLRQAQQNFNYADPEYIDAAIYELKAVEEKFRAMIREVKRNEISRRKCGRDKNGKMLF